MQALGPPDMHANMALVALPEPLQPPKVGEAGGSRIQNALYEIFRIECPVKVGGFFRAKSSATYEYSCT
jgi:hypothetical protein